MEYKKRIRKTMAAAAMLLPIMAMLAMASALTSCCKDDDPTRYDPNGTQIEHPALLTVNVSGAAAADSIAIVAIPTTAATAATRATRATRATTDNRPAIRAIPLQNATPTDLETGAYRLYAITMAPADVAALKAQGASATIDPWTGNVTITTANGGTLPNIPSILVGTTTTTLPEGTTTTATITVAEATAEIAIKGQLKGIDPATIKTATVTITGIADTKNTNTGTVTSTITGGQNITVTLTIAPDGSYTATIHLIGTTPDATQSLTLNITTTDGNVITNTQDITSQLGSINTGGTATGIDYTLTFDLSGITGTITPWTPGWDDGSAGQ